MFKSRVRFRCAVLAAACAVTLAGCEVEKRALQPQAPLTPPTGPADARAKLYESNRYEVSEGGRAFRWAACDSCHTDPAPGYLDLNDDAWRQGGSVPAIYNSIANGAPGMPAYGARLTPQQIWRLSGYVHGLHELKPEVRRRNASAQQGEPSGSNWPGPLS
jgi:cytochrome c oxidase cbb3-type subunit 3